MPRLGATDLRQDASPFSRPGHPRAPRIPSLSEFPLVIPLHRLAMSVIRAQRNREQLFDLYRQAWRKAGRSQVARTNFGARMRCDLGDLIPSTIFHFGVWEPDLSHWVSRLLSPGDVFVDVGANIGYYSVLAARLVGETGSVVAIEASPTNFARLQQNLRANRIRNVRAVNLAVAAEAGTVTVYSGPPQNSGAASTLPEWRNGRPEATVSALPLDAILTDNERSRTALIKIDVEGAEMPILRQMAATMALYPERVAIIAECNAKRAGVSSVFDELRAAGFNAYEVPNRYDARWYLDWREAAQPQPLNGLATGQADILFIRGDLFARAR